jgi:hypothetical protein
MRTSEFTVSHDVEGNLHCAIAIEDSTVQHSSTDVR